MGHGFFADQKTKNEIVCITIAFAIELTFDFAFAFSAYLRDCIHNSKYKHIHIIINSGAMHCLDSHARMCSRMDVRIVRGRQ